MYRGNYEPPEPDEYGRVVEIVVARDPFASSLPRMEEPSQVRADIPGLAVLHGSEAWHGGWTKRASWNKTKPNRGGT